MATKNLLVEGAFDKHVIWEIVKNTTTVLAETNIQPFKKRDETGVKDDEQGIYALLKTLPTTINAAYPDDIIGVVIDADSSSSGRWERILQILTTLGYKNLPDSFLAGLVVASDEALPRIGVWMMPDNEDEGVIETFIRRIIHEQDKLQPEVDAALSGLKTKELQFFSDVHRPKAFIRTWLAWQKSPGISPGTAISMKVLTTDADLCLRFVSWLTLLFNAQ
ncbi:DUF3226 domain-containing protein [Spirosoma aerophilum]